MFPLIQLPRKSEVQKLKGITASSFPVSINSTSEEVRRLYHSAAGFRCGLQFPLIQLPRKSEEKWFPSFLFWSLVQFPLIQLPRKSEAIHMEDTLGFWTFVSINSTSEEVRSRNDHGRSLWSVIVSINSTSEEVRSFGCHPHGRHRRFPLIQLPRKSEVYYSGQTSSKSSEVSINSTSEEVRSIIARKRRSGRDKRFPLIQLPRKSEALDAKDEVALWGLVSINSTSEEVRSIDQRYPYYRT